MSNSLCDNCGGCPLRNLPQDEYQTAKLKEFSEILSALKKAPLHNDEAIFIKDGNRRRAELDFCIEKKELKIGFYENKTHNIVDITTCPMLDKELNETIQNMRGFLKEFLNIPIETKIKKKILKEYIKKGSIRLLKADNGVDITLILPQTPNVNHRILVGEFVNSNDNVMRFSFQINNSIPENIVVKMSPQLYISGFEIDIPSSTFLQASKEAELKMIENLETYLGQTTGNILDLFCGLGTFTYPLAKNKNNNIVSIDSSTSSLEGLQRALAKNQIHNVKVINKNLFKYPLENDELKNIDAIVIDPPRAGAHEQCRKILELPFENKPPKIIFISCNPKTFVYDANVLMDANYTLERITLIDQFVYSTHIELMALFTLTPQ